MLSDKKKVITALTLVTGFLFYSFFIYSTLPVKYVKVVPEVSKGKLVWQQYNCNACHQVYGLGGYLGPDLTNEYSVKGPDYIKAFLKSGTVTMPNFHLNEEEIKDLLSYLQNIDLSGKADPRTFTINTDGTIQQ